MVNAAKHHRLELADASLDAVTGVWTLTFCGHPTGGRIQPDDSVVLFLCFVLPVDIAVLSVFLALLLRRIVSFRNIRP